MMHATCCRLQAHIAMRGLSSIIVQYDVLTYQKKVLSSPTVQSTPQLCCLVCIYPTHPQIIRMHMMYKLRTTKIYSRRHSQYVFESVSLYIIHM